MIYDCGVTVDSRRYFSLKNQVGPSGAGSDPCPVGDVRGDVSDVSGVEDYFFSALNAESPDLSGAVIFLHGVAGDKVRVPFVMTIWSAHLSHPIATRLQKDGASGR